MGIPKIRESFILITAISAMVVSCYIVFVGILALNFIYIIIGVVLIWSNFKGVLAILKQQQRSLKIYIFGNLMLIVLSFVIWSSVRKPGAFTVSDLYVVIPVVILSISTYCAATVKIPFSPLGRIPTPPLEDTSTIITPPKYEDIPIASTYDDLPPPYTITALAMPEQSIIMTTTTTTTTIPPIINTQLNFGETTHTQVPLQQVTVTQIVQPQQQSAPVDMSDRNSDNNNNGGNDLNGNGNTSNTITTQISNDIREDMISN